MPTPINTPHTPLTVSYESGPNGFRNYKQFDEPAKAKSYYAKKSRQGLNPKVHKGTRDEIVAIKMEELKAELAMHGIDVELTLGGMDYDVLLAKAQKPKHA